IEETGTTFEANARLKAEGVARATGAWTLAEDSGLVVPGLNGRPGVHSARYAGRQGDDAANNARLVAELAPLPPDRRSAYYVCVAVLANPGGELLALGELGCVQGAVGGSQEIGPRAPAGRHFGRNSGAERHARLIARHAVRDG